MPVVAADALTDFVQKTFVACGVAEGKAETVARSLVLGNLKGHDSHGVIRVLEYVDWIACGWIVPDAEPEVVRETDSLLLIDGHFGFGQVVGREATARAIDKAKKGGVCVLSLRRSAHLGRIGEWAEMAADAGLVCFSFTNTHGGGVLVAPHGGRERRLSANPLGAGAPLPDGGSVVLDFATSTIAEGKLKVARAKGEAVPEGCFVDGSGALATDPDAYYADPPGALLPFGEHKGFALSLFADLLAGGLSGAGCSKGEARIANAMLAVFVDPAALAGEAFFLGEAGALAARVKACPPRQGFDEVLLPGEPEERALARRTREGIPIEDATWARLVEIGQARGVAAPTGHTL